MDSDVEFEKLLCSTFYGIQCCQVFPTPVKRPLRLSLMHFLLLGYIGEALERDGIKSMQMIYQGEKRRILPYKPAMASSLSRLLDKRGKAHPLCSRALLERVQANLATNGWRFRVGVEIEFFVFKADGSLLAPEPGYASRIVADPQHPAAALLEDVVRALKGMDIPVLKYHAEARDSKLEVAFPPFSPIDAADAVLRFKEVVKDIASLHKLQVSLAPVLQLSGKPQHAGIHYHISTINEEPNPHLPEDAGYLIAASLHPHERSFAAGILQHLPALLGITMPHATSYARLLFMGRVVGWGSELHISSLRLCYDIDESDRPSYRWEYRGADGTADPLLSLAAILSAGGQAMLEKRSLDWPDMADPEGSDRMLFMMAHASLAQMKEIGASRLLPQTLAEALDELAKDVELQNSLGYDIVKTHIAVRREHATMFDAKVDSEKHGFLLKMF